jgi:hypothetical protein
MLTWTERHAIAQHHVAEGQRVIESHRELTRKQDMLGRQARLPAIHAGRRAGS